MGRLRVAELSPGDTFARGDTYCRVMLDAEDVFHTNAAGQDTRISGHPCHQTFGLETDIGTPPHLNGEVWGTLNFSSALPRSQPFDEMEVELVRLIADAVERVITDAAEIEQVRQERDRMSSKALRDYLTGLPNRACQDQHVEALSGRIAESLREDDLVAHTGGEEFVVVPRGTRPPGAAAVLKRVREHVNAGRLTLEDGQSPQVTVSGGVSEHHGGGRPMRSCSSVPTPPSSTAATGSAAYRRALSSFGKDTRIR